MKLIRLIYRIFRPRWKTIISARVSVTFRSCTSSFSGDAVAYIQRNKFGRERGIVDAGHIRDNSSPEFVRLLISQSDSVILPNK